MKGVSRRIVLAVALSAVSVAVAWWTLASRTQVAPPATEAPVAVSSEEQTPSVAEATTRSPEAPPHADPPPSATQAQAPPPAEPQPREPSAEAQPVAPPAPRRQ